MKSLVERYLGYWADADSEERQYTRKSLNRLLLTAPLPGRILDVNGTGIGVETLEPLAVRARNTFACAADNMRFELFGEVRWCQQSGTIPRRGDPGVPVYRAGIVFVERQRAND